MVTSVVLENKIDKVTARINKINRLLEYEYSTSALDRVRKDKGLITKASELKKICHIELRIERLERELKMREKQLIDLKNTTPHKYTNRVKR